LQFPKTSGLVIWLLPGPEHSTLYSDLISRLADIYDSPSFTPHITLSKFPELNQKSIVEIMDTLADELKPSMAEIGVPVIGSSPFQKVTIPLDDRFLTDQYSKKVDNILGGKFAKREGFHLSLLYSTLDQHDINIKQIKEMCPDIKKLHIQSIALVDLNFTPGKWKIIFERNL
jgi:hypothetical protein